MKVLFVDIDGVLVNWLSLVEGPEIAHSYSVDALNWLTRETGAQIVVSSAWRLRGLEYIQQLFQRWKVEAPVLDITPTMERQAGNPEILIGPGRGAEIARWLKAHPDVTSYVILDDDRGELHSLQIPYLVQTRFEEGLTMLKSREAKSNLEWQEASRAAKRARRIRGL